MTFINVFCLISCILCAISDYLINRNIKRFLRGNLDIKNIYNKDFYDSDVIEESDFE